MTENYLDSRYLFPNRLTCLGDCLMRFSERSVVPVVVRNIEKKYDLKKMKILIHNQASADFWGLSTEGMSEMPTLDLCERLSPVDRKAHIEQLERADRKALDNQYQSIEKQIICDATGFVRAYERFVMPVHGIDNQIIAMATVSYDLTRYVNLLPLLNLYKKYYTQKSQILEKFSSYLNLTSYFIEPPSLEEVSVLCAMIQDIRHKSIAEVLKLSPKTINNYTDTMKAKLKPNIDLHMVLNCMQANQHYPTDSLE